MPSHGRLRQFALILVGSLVVTLAAGAEDSEQTIRQRGDKAFGLHQYAVAEKSYGELLRRANQAWGKPWSGLIQDGLRPLIEAWRVENRLTGHDEQWQRELSQLESRYGANSVELIRTLQSLGLAANARGDYRGALAFFDRIAAILDRAHPKRHATREVRAQNDLDDGVLYQQFLVFLHLAAKDDAGARKQMAFREVAIRTIGNGVGSGTDAALDNLYDEIVCAWTPLLDGDAASAATRLEAAATKAERLLGNDHFNTATVFDALATALDRAGKSDRAAQAKAHAESVRRRAIARQGRPAK